MNFTPQQDQLAVTALRRLTAAEEALSQARHEINMERPAPAVKHIADARLDLVLADATVRKLMR